VSDKKITKEGLQTAEAVLGLGLVVVRELQTRGIATVFVNGSGEIELCPPGEYALDTFPKEEALDTLLEASYSDEQLEAYLKGRAARARLNNV
jgi:hypothetical protein